MNGDEELMFGITRREAVEDGWVTFVTDEAKREGFVVPVAIAMTVYADCVLVPEGAKGQKVTERIQEIIRMLWRVVSRSRPGTADLLFVVTVGNDDTGPKAVTLKAVLGILDGTEGITVVYPHEH